MFLKGETVPTAIGIVQAPCRWRFLWQRRRFAQTARRLVAGPPQVVLQDLTSDLGKLSDGNSGDHLEDEFCNGRTFPKLEGPVLGHTA